MIQIVTNRNLTAKSITAAVQIHLVVLVVTSLYQNGDIQIGHADSIDDSNLKAKVGQGNYDTVNAVTILSEQFRTLQSVFAGFNTATAGRSSVFR